MSDKKLKVLYIFAGERKRKEELWKKGEYPDTEFWGINHLKDFGIEAGYLENKAINFIRRKSFNLFNLFFVFKIRKYDIVFLSGSLSLVFLEKIILKFSKPKIIFFNTYFTNLLERNRSGLKARMIRKTIESLDAIICPSKAQKEFLIKEEFDGQNIHFIPTGVDVDFISSFPSINHEGEKFIASSFNATFVRAGMKTYPAARRDADPPAGGEAKQEDTTGVSPWRFILSVGKDMGRDYKTLVEAVRRIDIKVKIVAFPRNVVGLDLPTKVSVQALPFIELLSLYRNCEFVVIPTKKQENIDGSDCSGHLVLLDAMAAGKAIIASYRDTLNEYITNGIEGLVIEPENPQKLKEAIEKLLANPQMALDMGKRARERARRELTTKIFAQRLAEIFLQTAKQ